MTKATDIDILTYFTNYWAIGRASRNWDNNETNLPTSLLQVLKFCVGLFTSAKIIKQNLNTSSNKLRFITWKVKKEEKKAVQPFIHLYMRLLLILGNAFTVSCRVK